ncbi:hypothetical protein KUV56_05810 [Ferrimonas balearica]|uniref:hypothetical protein n=1 Tax=Ferrimonas balearica TaxID=44012 RepID=UPI001C5A43F2|nr:hypothetical protein [Ferrimonas balearica]MBW3139042.1 hypothetical protein [Ferrimonas balearica]
MSEAWRRLAQTARGESLIHQVAQSLYADGRWSFVALGHHLNGQVRIQVASQAGQALAPIEYPLDTAPCRLLYQANRPVDSLIYYPQLKRFSHWPLVHQFELGCYLGRRLDLPPALGEFHLFIMDKISRAEQELPKRLLVTAADRVADDLRRRADEQELNALRQMQQSNPLAFARLSPSGQIHQISEGFAQRLDKPQSELHGRHLGELVDLGENLSVRDLLANPAGIKRPARVIDRDGRPVWFSLELSPIDGQLGFVVTLTPSAPNEHNAFESGHLGDESLLHDRVQHELARLHRNQQVAALFFIGIDGGEVSEAQWHQLNDLLRPLLRSEDLVAQRDEQYLAVLTACFDNRGKPPREQMSAIAGKLHQQLQQWPAREAGQLVIRSRLLTSWDNDPAQVLDPAQATRWRVPDASLHSTG